MSIEYPDYPEAIPGDDAARLFNVIRQAIAELDAEHQPVGGPRLPGPDGRCVTCSPQHSGWPCVSRMVADDLRFMLESIE